MRHRGVEAIQALVRAPRLPAIDRRMRDRFGDFELVAELDGRSHSVFYTLATGRRDGADVALLEGRDFVTGRLHLRAQAVNAATASMLRAISSRNTASLSRTADLLTMPAPAPGASRLCLDAATDCRSAATSRMPPP